MSIELSHEAHICGRREAMKKVALVSFHAIPTEEKGAGRLPSGIGMPPPGFTPSQPAPNIPSGASSGRPNVTGSVTFIKHDIGSLMSGGGGTISVWGGGVSEGGRIISVEKVARITGAATFEPEAADLGGARSSGTEVGALVPDAQGAIEVHGEP